MDQQNDHDLLIEMRTEMRSIRADIKDLKDGTTKRIDDLEKDKADRKDVEALQKRVDEDFEKRIRSLEDERQEQAQNNKDMKNYYKFIIGLGLLILGIVIYHLTGYHL